MNRLDENAPERDMDALGARNRRNLPTQAETARAVQARLTRATREGSMKKLAHVLSARPAIPAALGIAVLAAILLVLPIPLERTIGYEVRLRLPEVDAERGQAIAAEFGRLLRTADCRYAARPQGSAESEGSTVTARVPDGSRRLLQGLSLGYAQRLAMQGVAARAAVTPIRERYTANVYAAAAAEIHQLRVNVDGRTNEEIAAELQAQFEAAGLSGAVVTVTGSGDQLQMEMQWTAPPGAPSEGEKEFHITMEGNR